MGVWEDCLKAARHEKPERIPVVLWSYGLVLKRFSGVTEYEYYQNVKLQLEAKVAFQKRFPNILNLHMFPEYCEHHGPIPTAFGAELAWMEDAPPWIKDYPIEAPEDVDRLVESGVPDPHEVGVTSEMLRRYQYFYDWFPRELREEYGYIDGWIYPGECIEGAALTMGYDKFLVWLRRYPDVIHKWLKLSTDFLLKYCEAIENIVGKCRVFVLADHMASMVGKELFSEFILPYLNKILKKYSGALRVWHNEGSVSHMLREIDKIEAEVWHFGSSDDPAQCKAETHFCLMGNLYPPWFVESKPNDVVRECEKIIRKVDGDRLWLSTGGGLAPATPFRNIDAMVMAAERYA